MIGYTEEQRKEIFHDWIQRLLTEAKRKFMLDSADSATIGIKIPDGIDPDFEAEIKITVRRKK